MILKLQKRLAASVMGCSPKKIVFDPAKLEDIKEAITKTDIRLLIGDGTIRVKQNKGVSRVRANKIKLQKSRGLQRGAGSRKGKATARTPGKETWVKKIRAQRTFLAGLRETKLISDATYKTVYMMAGGGYFRSIQHIKIYLAERNLWTREKKAASSETAEHKIKTKDRKN